MLSTFASTLPGTNPHDAHSMLRDTCGRPGLGILPDRGPGADAVGRLLGLISKHTGEFAGQTTTKGWRVTAGRGRDMRRADKFLTADLDEVHEIFDGYSQPFKFIALGPITLAANLELVNGEKVLADMGALRDLISAYSASLEVTVADLQRRLPSARIEVQLDEQLMANVVRGDIPSQSGYRRYAPIPEIELRELLSKFLVAQRPMLNLESSIAQLSTFTATEVSGYVVELSSISEKHFDAIGNGFDSGLRYAFGLPHQEVSKSVQQLTNVANQIGFALGDWVKQLDCYPTNTNQSLDLSAYGARIERLNQVVDAMEQEVG